MCMGTVFVGDPAAPSVKIEDVVGMSFTDQGIVVETLFGEKQTLAHMRCRHIDMSRGVKILLEEIDQ